MDDNVTHPFRAGTYPMFNHSRVPTRCKPVGEVRCGHGVGCHLVVQVAAVQMVGAVLLRLALNECQLDLTEERVRGLQELHVHGYDDICNVW